MPLNTMYLGNMTDREAVNLILTLAGHTPIATTVDIETHPEALAAWSLVQEQSRFLQTTEWWGFNTNNDVTLSPVASEVSLPTDTLSAVFYDKNYTYRGTKVFNRKTNTFTVTIPVKLQRLRQLLQWNDLPYTFRVYTCIMAARQYGGSRILPAALERFNEQQLYLAKAAALQEDNEIAGENYSYAGFRNRREL